jgi:hypothetical protein
MINSFSTFLVEEEKTLYFVWGRMNPPTAGHEKLLDFLKAKAGRNPFRIYLTQSEDNSKNPIPFTDKVKFARKGFPQYGRQIMMNKKLKTIFDAMTSFYNEGFKRIVIVAGNDRVRQYEILLNKYNGVKGKHGFYNFEKINVLDAGKRDPESTGVEGVSGTKLRGYAENGDFTKFAQYMPKRLSNADSKSVYNAVRKGLGLKEEKEFKNHIQLESVSDLRESYVNGELFKVGDQVVMKENGEIGTVKRLGSNYVIIEGSGNQYRRWLDSVERVEEKRPEYETALFSQSISEEVESPIFDVAEFSTEKQYDDEMTVTTQDLQEGTMQRFKNFESKDTHKTKDGRTAKKGLWYNINQKRKRGEKPAKPGDKDYPKTLDIEAVDHIDVAKKRIDGEKMTDKMRHDRMMDRARMRDTVKKNKETK